jgi:predicted ABC-type ATPase
MVAGPNGSGKSTLYDVIPRKLINLYINPDEIEKTLRASSVLDLNVFGIQSNGEELLDFLRLSPLITSAGMADQIRRLVSQSGCIRFDNVEVNAYFASAIADFVRRRLLDQGISFTFETVMSSPDKVALLELAHKKGYRTYLYYVATRDPAINKSRVANRVLRGGHSVPDEKIESRYYRSLSLLVDAIRHTDRAYIFDNSLEGYSPRWLAEITDGKDAELRASEVPDWFNQYVLDHFSSNPRA